jgi:vesicle transport protein SEC22
MSFFTLVCRVTDGFPLVASTDTAPAAGLETVKGQCRQIAKRLDGGSGKQIVDSGAFFISYAVEDATVVLVVTERSYPKRLTFQYIAEVHAAFVEELSKTHGSDWRAALARVERPYSYLSFDRTMQRLHREYADTQSKANQARLADEIGDVHNIMRKNISELLDRGEKLGALSATSAKLREESKRFKWGAKKLNYWDAISKAAPIVATGVFLLAFLYWRFFW